jgi:hypothetical protein
MRWIFILLAITLLLIIPATAAEIGIEKTDGSYLLAFSSTQPYVISAYTVHLDYDPTISVLRIDAIEPFEVFSKIYPEEGYIRISAFAMTPHIAGTYIPLARIMADSGFSPLVHVEFLEDYDCNSIPVDKMTISDLENETLQPYLPEGTDIPATSAPIVPNEVRVAWTLPVDVLVPGTMLTVTPTITPEVTLIITHTGENEDVLSPFEVVPADQTPSSIMIVERSDIPVSPTPVSVIPVIGGLIIVIIIIRSRV